MDMTGWMKYWVIPTRKMCGVISSLLYRIPSWFWKHLFHIFHLLVVWHWIHLLIRMPFQNHVCRYLNTFASSVNIGNTIRKQILLQLVEVFPRQVLNDESYITSSMEGNSVVFLFINTIEGILAKINKKSNDGCKLLPRLPHVECFLPHIKKFVSSVHKAYSFSRYLHTVHM